jgi:hypothetical protein
VGLRVDTVPTAEPEALRGWTPIELYWELDRPVIRWCFTEGVDFTDPFFDQTIDRTLRDPFRLLFWRETGIEALAEFAGAHPGPGPSGLIFHTSRSGSTLVSQMLAGLATTLVMSEPGPFDQVLRARSTRPGLPEGQVADWLRWLASALGQPRRAGQSSLVLKLDAWAILDWPLIRRAFPDAACVFVYREPTEVIVSQLGQRGYHMIPGTLSPARLGLSNEQAGSLRSEEYCAAVLAALCRAALDAAGHGELRLVNYKALPEAVPDTIARLFGIDVGPPERAVFATVAERDAKNPVLAFVPDGADKQKRTTAQVRAAGDAWVGPLYESLEALRLGRS